jgi:HEPN domain-containing protein
MRFKEIAKAFWLEAKDDLESAELVLDGDKFSKVATLSQQSAEKIIKAVLACEKILGVVQHEVAEIFAHSVKIQEEWKERIEKAQIFAKDLEKYAIKTRYPLYGREDLPIWIPSKGFPKEKAEDALEKAKFVFENLTKLLKEVYGVEVEE